MNKVFLKSLIIKDFKGIKDLSIEFGDITTIKGDNGLGKTSVFDAFTWLLFDKDSKNRTTFDIKPLDSNNQVIKGLTPTVTGIFNVDGKVITLSKTYKEKWTKKKGEAESQFTGNETLCEVDNVPFKKKDYVEKVSTIVEEEKFKLLSNPYYFSSSLNWKDARKVIIDIAGDIAVEEIVKVEPRLEEIKEELLQEDIEMILKSKKATMTKLSKEKKEIPVRINEIRNSYVDLDLDKLEQENIQLGKELEDTNFKIQQELVKMNDFSKSNEEVNQRIRLLENDRNSIISKGRQSFYEHRNLLEANQSEIKHKLYTLQKDKQYNKSHIEEINMKMSKAEAEKKLLSEKYLNTQAEKPTLEELQKECPTCKRGFEKEFIEEMEQQIVKNFNLQKAKRLESIKQDGLNKKECLDEYNKELKEIQGKLLSYDKEISELEIKLKSAEESIKNTKDSLSSDDELSIKKIDEEIYKLRSEGDNALAYPTNTLDSLNNMKDLIVEKISDIKSEISKKDYNKQLDNRIEELLLAEKDLGCKIAQFEKQVMLCELFVRTRVNLLETGINAKFKHVGFKMFKEQVNGALDETCEALINGVPFSMANTASQINAGLDIINTLSKFYEVSVPVFIDNAEAINDILRVDSQVVKLVVSLDKKIMVEGE